jgi:hypothetical protein
MAAARLVVHAVNVEDGRLTAALPGVQVTIAGRVTRTECTDGSGTARFLDLPPGVYLVRGVLPSFGGDKMNVCVSENEVRATLVLRAPPPHIDTIIAGAQPTAGDIAGSIVDSEYTALRDGVIDVVDYFDRVLESGRSGSDGRFSFVRVPFGTYTLRVRHAGYQSRDVIVSHYGFWRDVGAVPLVPACGESK